jgi:hypothetical protein
MIYVYILAVLGIKPRVLLMIIKCFSIVLYPQPLHFLKNEID